MSYSGKKRITGSMTNEQVRREKENNSDYFDVSVCSLIYEMCKKFSATEFRMLSIDPKRTGEIMAEVVYDYVRPGQMN